MSGSGTTLSALAGKFAAGEFVRGDAIKMARRFFALACLAFCLPLAGCGFHPVYGAHGGGDAVVAGALNDIAIDNIPERNGQIMRNDLIDRMYGKGRPAQPQYHLHVTVKPAEEDLGIQANATSTRTLLNMYADYSLKDAAGKEVLHGTAHSVSSFDKISDQYSTLAAREDAYARTIDECGTQIVNRLSLFFAERSDAPPAAAP